MRLVCNGICERLCLSDRVEQAWNDIPPDEPHYETLVRADRLRVALVTLDADQVLREHAAPGPMTLQILRGKIYLDIADERYVLDEGEVIALEERVRHVVTAVTRSAFLLTVSWPAHLAGDPMF